MHFNYLLTNPLICASFCAVNELVFSTITFMWLSPSGISIEYSYSVPLISSSVVLSFRIIVNFFKFSSSFAFITNLLTPSVPIVTSGSIAAFTFWLILFVFPSMSVTVTYIVWVPFVISTFCSSSVESCGTSTFTFSPLSQLYSMLLIIFSDVTIWHPSKYIYFIWDWIINLSSIFFEFYIKNIFIIFFAYIH